MLSNFMKLFLLALLICAVSGCPSGWYPSQIDSTRCYYVSQEKMGWDDAERFCRSFSTLTSVLSAFESHEIYGIAGNNPSIGTNDEVWIGAKGSNGDLRFQWVDGSSFSYTNWLAGQPNLNYPCVSALARSSLKWQTSPCDAKNYFICRYSMQPTATPTDCHDYHFQNGNSTDGIYRINPSGVAPFDVWCDMNTDAGGWTVIQNRIDVNGNASLKFQDRTWNEYKNGFNNGMNSNMWLGNDNIYVLSNKDSNVELRFEISGRCLAVSDWSKCNDTNHLFAKFTSFKIDNEANKYTFHISNSDAVSNNIGMTNDPNGIYYNSGKPFSTMDNQHGDRLCDKGQGGWWIGACTYVDLNGDATPGTWYYWHTQEFFIYMSQSRMLIRKMVH